MLKFINKIGDFLFRFSDNFFKDESYLSSMNYSDQKADDTLDSLRYMSWDLNQGLNTILWKDIRHIVRFLIPHTFLDRISYEYKKILFLAEVDGLLGEDLELFPYEMKTKQTQTSFNRNLSFSNSNQFNSGKSNVLSFVKQMHFRFTASNRKEKNACLRKYFRVEFKVKLMRLKLILARLSYKVRGPDPCFFFPVIIILMRN